MGRADVNLPVGDVLRIFSGDFKRVKSEVSKSLRGVTDAILMRNADYVVVVSLTLRISMNRWANIIVAIFAFSISLA
jgi:hypothetical protein